MRIKELFTIPEGKKVTERVFGRVLLSSVFSILLCMVCLISTTWAWFTVSIENEGNEIRIATVTPIVEVKNGDVVVPPADDGRYTLGEGTTYTIGVGLDNNATETDDLNKTQGKVYVVITVVHNGETKSYYFTFAGGEVKQLSEFRIGSGTAAVSISASWIKPASAAPVGSEAVVIGQIPTEPTTASTAAAEVSTVSEREPLPQITQPLSAA